MTSIERKKRKRDKGEKDIGVSVDKKSARDIEQPHDDSQLVLSHTCNLSVRRVTIIHDVSKERVTYFFIQ